MRKMLLVLGLLLLTLTSCGDKTVLIPAKTCEQVLREAYIASQTDAGYMASETVPSECAGLSEAELMQLATKIMAESQ